MRMSYLEYWLRWVIPVPKKLQINDCLVLAALNRALWQGCRYRRSIFAIVPRTMMSARSLIEHVRQNWSVQRGVDIQVYVSTHSIGLLCRLKQLSTVVSPVMILKSNPDIEAPDQLFARCSGFMACWAFVCCCRRCVETDFKEIETKSSADFADFIVSEGFALDGVEV